MRRLFALALAILSWPVAAGQSSLEIRQAWVRAVPPVSSSTAAYFELENRGETAVMIRGARTEIAGQAMFHRVVAEDGEHRMVHMMRVEVPAGGVVRFQPGGRHLMLMELTGVPAEGETVEICLMLADGELCHDFPVRRRGAGP